MIREAPWGWVVREMILFILIIGKRRQNPNVRDVEKRPLSAESCERKVEADQCTEHKR